MVVARLLADDPDSATCVDVDFPVTADLHKFPDFLITMFVNVSQRVREGVQDALAQMLSGAQRKPISTNPANPDPRHTHHVPSDPSLSLSSHPACIRHLDSADGGGLFLLIALIPRESHALGVLTILGVILGGKMAKSGLDSSVDNATADVKDVVSHTSAQIDALIQQLETT